MSQDLSVDFIKQSVNSGYLEFFELEVGKSSTDPATNILYFHAGTNGSMQDVTYDSKTYVAIPIFMSRSWFFNNSNNPLYNIINICKVSGHHSMIINFYR